MSFSPDQERDENGRWTGGDGAIKASQSARTPAEHAAAGKLHREANAKAPAYSNEAQMHWLAVLAHQSLAQTSKGGSVFSEAPKVSSGLSKFLGGKETPARGTAAQIIARGGKVNFQTAVSMTKPTRGKDSMSVLERLARRGHRAAAAVLDAWNPDQPRDERGRWGEGGPGSGAEAPSEHEASAKYHRDEAKVYNDAGHKAAGKAHEEAAMAHEEAAKARSVTGIKGRMAFITKAMSRQLSTTANAESKKIRDQAVSGMVSPHEHARMASAERRMVSSGNDPRTTSSHEQDKMEARQLASGDRVPLKQGPTQSGGYKGNPAAEGSRAVKEDDRARFNAGPSDPVHGGSGRGTPYNRDVKKELSPVEHRIAQAMSTNRSDSKALAAAGMSREEGIKAAASAREKLGVGPGGSLKEAYKKLSPTTDKGGRSMSDRTKDRIDKSISEGKGRSSHQMASEHAASGRRDVAAKYYDDAAKHYETAGNSSAATNMRWKSIEMRQGKKK